MTKAERAVEVVTALLEARAEVASLETILAELIGEDGGGREKSPPADRRDLIAARAADTAPSVKKGERTSQVVAMVNAGKKPKQIAAELGCSRGAVDTAIWTARKNGLLPKAEGRE